MTLQTINPPTAGMPSKNTYYCFHYSFNFSSNSHISHPTFKCYIIISNAYLDIFSEHYFIDFKQPSGFRQLSEYVNLTFLNFLIIQTQILI